VNPLEGAAPGPAMLPAVMADSSAAMPVTTAYLLDFEVGATFAQGAERIRPRIAAGRVLL